MTNKQKQCLLSYLGYYNGAIDGVFGSASKEATAAFQKDYGLESDGIFGPKTQKKIKEAVCNDEQPQVNWDSVKYFDREEFRCTCAGAHCSGFPVEMNPRVLSILDEVRGHFGAAGIVSSGVRCEKRNATIGGVAQSRHLLGKAADFRIKGKSAAEVLTYVKTLPGVRYAYAIDSAYVHVDVE